jgi:Zn-dependent peptidase ImmA (M78 family)/transcriptional regulator with XRE-family HTH domain
MGITDLGANMERYRALRNIKVQELCENAGITGTAYRNIVNGAQPRAKTVKAIAKGLSISVFKLVRPIPEVSAHFRSRATGKKAQMQEKQISFDLDTKKRNFNILLEILDRPPMENPLDHLRQFYRNSKDPKALAYEARVAFNLADQPVMNICSLFEKQGIKVFPIKSNLEDFFGVCLDEQSGPAICINVRENLTTERQVFSAAHELAHLIMHCDSSLMDEDAEAEEKADEFAGNFLIPHKGLLKKLHECKGLHFIDQVIHCKSHFGVSYRAIMHRMDEIASCGYQRLKSFFLEVYEMRYNKQLNNREEPFPAQPARFEEDGMAGMVRDAIEGDLITMSRGAEILELDLYQMRSLVESWSLLGDLACPV